MDFELTEEQKMFQAMARDFCAAEIVPHAAEWDESEEFPYDVIKKMAAAGLNGVHFPEEYGGSGDEVTFAIATEEIARACAGISVVYLVALAWACIQSSCTAVNSRKSIISLVSSTGQ